MSDNEITPYHTIKIQMEYMVPIIRGLQKYLGEEAVLQALRKHNEDLTERARAKCKGPRTPDRSKLESGFAHFNKGDILKYEFSEDSDAGEVRIDVKDCGFAKLMYELDATDLGDLLICAIDYPFAERDGLTLKRTQTRMLGASHCDFCYSRGDLVKER